MSDARNRSDGEGAGALLGLAAGDQLAALQLPDRSSLYGFRTQQATIMAYHLLRWGSVRPDALRSELVELAFSEEGPSAYRGEPAWFLRFLEEARSGRVTAGPSGDGAAPLTMPIGLWHRWNTKKLIGESLEAASVTHRDGLSLAAAAALAGAVAAASFGQHGRDFINAVAEFASQSLEELGSRESPGPASSFVHAIPDGGQWLGTRPKEVIAACSERAGAAGPVLAAIILGAVPWDLSEDAVRATAAFPSVAPLVGGIVGARRGVSHWPWDMANEHWFAEIGRRLVRQSRAFEDLPDPYAVEITLVYPGWAPHGAV